MKSKTILFLFFLGFITLKSCTIFKEDRRVKKQSREWRESSIVMHAYADSPMFGYFLILRENGKFEHSSSGIIKSFSSGDWIKDADTLTLSYMDSQQKTSRIDRRFIDHSSSTLILEGDTTPIMFRLKILYNKL